MMPGPPPVITVKPARPRRRPISRAERVVAVVLVEAGRAEDGDAGPDEVEAAEAAHEVGADAQQAAELARCGRAALRGTCRPRRAPSPCPSAAARRSAPRPPSRRRARDRGSARGEFLRGCGSRPSTERACQLSEREAVRAARLLLRSWRPPPRRPASRRSDQPRSRAQRFPNVVDAHRSTPCAPTSSPPTATAARRRPTSTACWPSGVRFTEARTVEPLTNPSLCLDVHLALPPRARRHPQRPAAAARPPLGGARRSARRGYRDAPPSSATGRSRTASRASATTSSATRRSSPASAGSACSRARPRPRTSPTPRSPGWARARKSSRPAVPALGPLRRAARPLPPAGGVRPPARHSAPHGDVSRPDRYDTEIAFADQHIGRLLAAFERDPRAQGQHPVRLRRRPRREPGRARLLGARPQPLRADPAHPPRARLDREDPARHDDRRAGPEPRRRAHHPGARRPAGARRLPRLRLDPGPPAAPPRRATGSSGSRRTRARCSRRGRRRTPAARGCWRWA